MEKTVLRLYVTGNTPRSQRAIHNLRAACDDGLFNAFQLEIVDVLEHPELAERDRILQTPTLIKLTPPPVRRIIGDLSDHDRLLEGLDLEEQSRSGVRRLEEGSQ